MARRVLVAVAVGMVLAAAPRTARADVDGSIAWAFAGMEYSGATALTLAMRRELRFEAGTTFLVTAVPFAGAAVGAVGAAWLDVGPRSANAAHGALWGGLVGAAFGAVLDGRTTSDGAAFGRASIATATIGALGGAAAGARLPDDRFAGPWLAAPIGGAFAGLIVGTIAVFVSPHERQGRTLMLAGGIGGLLGLVGGALGTLAVSADIEPTARRAPPVMFRIDGSL